MENFVVIKKSDVDLCLLTGKDFQAILSGGEKSTLQNIVCVDGLRCFYCN
jgi:hypothetical protein